MKDARIEEAVDAVCRDTGSTRDSNYAGAFRAALTVLLKHMDAAVAEVRKEMHSHDVEAAVEEWVNCKWPREMLEAFVVKGKPEPPHIDADGSLSIAFPKPEPERASPLADEEYWMHKHHEDTFALREKLKAANGQTIHANQLVAERDKTIGHMTCTIHELQRQVDTAERSEAHAQAALKVAEERADKAEGFLRAGDGLSARVKDEIMHMNAEGRHGAVPDRLFAACTKYDEQVWKADTGAEFKARQEAKA